MAKRIAIVQSNYLPWKGYFDLIRACDEFVTYDEVQYTRRDWRNRNRIKTAQGTQWITVPVQTKGRYDQRIDETLVEGSAWVDRHLRSIEHALARAPHFDELIAPLAAAFEDARDMERLSDVNLRLINMACAALGIGTPISPSTAYPSPGGRNERLLAICLAADADTYLSGPAAAGYLDTDMFEAAGVSVEFAHYGGYPEYPQLHGGFEHAVSVIDLIANVGLAAGPDHLIDVRPGRAA